MIYTNSTRIYLADNNKHQTLSFSSHFVTIIPFFSSQELETILNYNPNASLTEVNEPQTLSLTSLFFFSCALVLFYHCPCNKSNKSFPVESFLVSLDTIIFSYITTTLSSVVTFYISILQLHLIVTFYILHSLDYQWLPRNAWKYWAIYYISWTAKL